jgi:hypothetical protein
MSVTPSPIGGFAAQFFDNNGVILSGGKIYTYAAGTTTPQVTYTSASGTTPHANPIVLDSAGRVPGGEIWLTDGLVYKFVIETATGILLGTYDNITGVNSNFVNYTVQEEVITATAGQTVFNLSTINYTPGTNSLTVYIDGVNQYVGDSYLETDSNTVTFTSGVHVGGEVKFTTAVQTTTGAVDASIVSFTGFNGQTGVVQDLADDDGSDWIGFDASGTGAVARSAQAKMRDVVSVKDFGAVGDGVANDTAAIQAAIDYVLSVGLNGEVLFPIGEYLVFSPIVITDRVGAGPGVVNIKLRGLGPAGNAKGFYPGTYESALIKADATFSGAFVLGYERTPAVYGFQGIEIENISIDTSNVVDYGIQIDNPVGVTMNRVNAYRAKIANIYLNAVDGDGFNVNLTDIYLWGGNVALLANPTDYGILSNARYAMFNRVVMDGAQTGIRSSGDLCIFTNCHLEGNLTAIDCSTAGGGYNRIVNSFLSPYGWTGTSRGVKIEGLAPGAGFFNTVSANVIWSDICIDFDNSYSNSIEGNTLFGGATDPCIVLDANTGSAQWSIYGNQFNTTGVAVENKLNGGKIIFDTTNRLIQGTAFTFDGFTAFIYDENNRLTLGEVAENGTLDITNINNESMITLTGNAYEFARVNGFDADASYNAAAAVLKIGKEATTSRSINAGGTVNASGLDYAEYMEKDGEFTLAKGDICGITEKGKLTNEFSNAVSFVIKSSNPSFVGGDTFDLSDESVRETVDRVSFAGQVPINVIDATPGDYIVPIAGTEGKISASPITSPTFEQYASAVGKVISIQPDGRALVIVKVA